MRPHLEAIKEEMDGKTFDPEAVAEGHKRMKKLFKEYGHGGAFWFTDLTTPDALYVFPVLAALSFLVVVECNMQEGMEGNPMGDTMKKFSRILAFLTVPFTMTFPKAIFCYWITSNLFSVTYGMALKVPGVKQTLGIPDLPAAPKHLISAQTLSSIFRQQ
ncbi:unnamed protein product [Vicia faba]|uniref:Mitochondrial inner membrane protein OXA1-like n=1 Tax=Vicia faba TaxID=3906 RepID=A0AAV1B1F4_VICFA|nr:unnamed protein product [Vicia faba]